MESRKYQLKKQIIDALNSNDSDLYSLLKSQWAHRFGVESLEELKNLDSTQLDQNPNNLSNQNMDQSEENTVEVDELLHINDEDTHKKGIKTKQSNTTKDESEESFEVKSYETINKENNGAKAINSFIDNTVKSSEIKALIPLPPKPKYSYLQKWLLRK